ncbi:MAG TPA: 4Fe-4S dicluster domain-containing protein [Aggregatilinea sp.]|uniref:4Fe-4S dicluster domain-containing protein n=1 Tax=Aggregatilinea sp. TaxID=2806333 RepID=UPI002B843D0E|nr:4Fe-4S dicluster domain-containing protein [Aggregatilinea sp.]HML21957.1 4Fe-4S dicluster domain-containing protein [Aggregatilinea sp.]
MAHEITAPHYGFLIDASLCIDCRTCMVSCSVQNNVSMDTTRIWIEETGVTGTFPDLKRYTVPYHCMHCKDPSCASACTVGALHRNEEGIVTYDKDICIGCRYCMYACPFEVPNYEWEATLPLVVKCDMCAARLDEGQQPACATTCPTGAIRFGLYEDMLAEAHRMINENPGKYVNHVYGEEENGGTATLYISPVPFEELGFPMAGTSSPAYSNRLVTEGTPLVAGAMLVGLSGAYLTIKHLKEEAAAERREAEHAHAGEDHE